MRESVTIETRPERRRTVPDKDTTLTSTNQSNTTNSYWWYCWRMRVTSKGQVTIPQEVRRRLGIEPGTEVEFEVDDDGVRLVRRPTRSGAALVRKMRGRGGVSMSTGEIMALTRGDA